MTTQPFDIRPLGFYTHDKRFRTLNILVTLPSWCAPDEDEDLDSDFDVPGLYLVQVPKDLSDAHAACCARGGFNSQIAINSMEGFQFHVIDPVTGNLLYPDESLDFYALAQQCGKVHFLSRMNYRRVTPWL